MITGFIIKFIEKRVEMPLAYLRFIAKVSPRLFYRFLKIFSFANGRRVLPKDVMHAAALVATLAEDCGECLQIGINLAKQDGVPQEVIQAVRKRRHQDLPGHLQQACLFAEECVNPHASPSGLRDEMRATYGDEGLIELAMVIAAARVFPQVKRTLGYAVSCSIGE